VNLVYGLEFPEISHILVWPDFGPGGFNKIALIGVIATVLTFVLFTIAARGDNTVAPTGVRNVVESSVGFIQNGIIMQTMGPEGLGWTSFLTSLFYFTFFCNITEVIPVFQMPATARMALPAILGLTIWVLFIGTGLKHQGAGYFKEALFPPGVPKALYILVTPIELLSTFLVRPFSLAVRLFANMLAGHILLVTFGVLSAALWVKAWYAAFLPLPIAMLIFLTGFEVLVAFLQAYIITILAGVYIGGAMHPEH
jgi:F-type H+-transporting ATPase subunit a